MFQSYKVEPLKRFIALTLQRLRRAARKDGLGPVVPYASITWIRFAGRRRSHVRPLSLSARTPRRMAPRWLKNKAGGPERQARVRDPGRNERIRPAGHF